MILAIIPVPDKFKYDFSLMAEAEELNYLRKIALKSGKLHMVSAGSIVCLHATRWVTASAVIQHFIAGLLQ